jgi:FMN reductase
MSESAQILIITGSPVQPSRSSGLAALLQQRLVADGYGVDSLHVRDLPAEALMYARFDDPQIVQAARQVESAAGIIVVSPVYKAAYTGTFKAFIDLLPQYGLREKVVLPLLVGGSLAHVLALDYAVRPMLQSLDPRLIVAGLFLLDKTIDVSGPVVAVPPEVDARLEQALGAFLLGLHAPPPRFMTASAAPPAAVYWE